MLGDVFELFVAVLILAGLAVVAALVRRLFRRAPFLPVGMGTALLVLAATIVREMRNVNYQTDGSPAGLVIFGVLAGVVLVVAALGLMLTVRGFAYASDAGTAQLLVAVATMIIVGLAAVGYSIRDPKDDRSSSRAKPAPQPELLNP